MNTGEEISLKTTPPNHPPTTGRKRKEDREKNIRGGRVRGFGGGPRRMFPREELKQWRDLHWGYWKA